MLVLRHDRLQHFSRARCVGLRRQFYAAPQRTIAYVSCAAYAHVESHAEAHGWSACSRAAHCNGRMSVTAQAGLA